MPGWRRIASVAALVACASLPVRVGADEPSATSSTVPPTAAQALLAKLAADPAVPSSYRANVDLNVRLRVFPFIHVRLRGNSSYRRGLYRFVFTNVPLLAKGFEDLRYDLGDPSQWPERYTIALAPQSTPQMPVLRMIPHAAQQVRTLDVVVDPLKGHLMKAIWTRNDGGVITLVQTFGAVNDRELVRTQTATIDLPHVKATLDAAYSDFQVGAVPDAPPH